MPNSRGAFLLGAIALAALPATASAAGPRITYYFGLERPEGAARQAFFAAGDPFRSQALWSFTHGMVILEIDGRYPDGSDLDRTWAAGAAAFAD